MLPLLFLARFFTLILAVLVPLTHSVCADDPLGEQADNEQFFELKVRPVLVERCSECHGAKKQEGGFRVDSRAALMAGGDTAEALVPGDVDSLLLQAVRRAGELKMPPDNPLSQPEVQSLEQWVKAGAVWPNVIGPVASQSDDGKNHWAFQPVTNPRIPTVSNAAWVRTPVDAWIAQKHTANGLSPSPPADRRTLIRRVAYALTGLPPTPEDVEQFVNDQDADAYEKLVERLLASLQYGEHWARRWLDVARYSDTKGYVYAREERFWTHAWTYRDWVVRAFNNDMPYDRFLLLQLAADQVEDGDTQDLAAMGFLTLGRRFLGVKRDIIDDRIDVVCRGMMGLTVNCARCHDHKYDPIPTADYYSLYGVFENCVEHQTVLDDSAVDDAFRKELRQRQSVLQTKLQEYRQDATVLARQRTADYLFAQSELDKYPADGFDQVFQKTDLLPAFVRKWEHFLRSSKENGDPIFVLWHKYAELDPATFDQQAVKIIQELTESPSVCNSRVAAAFATPPHHFREVCDRYGELFTDVVEYSPDADAEAIRQFVQNENAPWQVPFGPIAHCEMFFDTSTLTKLWKLQGEVDRWLSSATVPVALSLIDHPQTIEPRIFRRGNPLKLGENVPRQFLAALSSAERQPFRHGSGRLELARAIIEPTNPLTARVMVNRVWAHHFGTGLVTSPSDFGLRSDSPSHPELLDWLATAFIREGWSVKQLQRWIVLSSTFQQASTVSSVATSSVDPDNRLLWRMNLRRLTFEELRESLLCVSGELDETLGGKPTNLFAAPYPMRRTIYGLVDRQYMAPMLRMFDFANPDLHVPQRSETTVPQQALFFMNHPMMIERVQSLAKLARIESDTRGSIEKMFRLTYQRAPTEAELTGIVDWIGTRLQKQEIPLPKTAADWTYGFGRLDETSQRVEDFAPLPHFTGDAWQGGPAWPDKKLGWVQLTADGGHPGNNRNVAAIRRWTAPRDTEIAIHSQLNHAESVGDGVRAFVVSSSQGLLKTTKIHDKTEDLDVVSLSVKAGETIDFIVDIDQVLNSDQYRWTVVVESRNAETNVVWNSATDFLANRVMELNAWEQLAQVLLCANEFLFVD